MNIISKLTMRHLNENRKRTVVTILGIAMSTALISAMMLGVFSFFKFFGYLAERTDGKGQVVYEEVSKEQFMSLTADERVGLAGLLNKDSKISGVRLDSGKEDRFRIGNVVNGNYDFFTVQTVTDYDGALPKNSSEIAVEEQFLKDNGLDLKIGDTLSFEQGNRNAVVDGKRECIGGNYRADEEFESLENVTCTITAILHGNRPTASYDIFRGLDGDFYPDTENAVVYTQLSKPDHTSIVQIKDIAADYGITKYQMNTEYLLSNFAFEGSDGTYKSFFAMMGIALAVVVATSVVLIVNSIEMSLTERLRYLGMLASVGATGKQKRFSIYYEGFILGIIGIPLGILIGYIGTKVTMNYMGSKILEAEILAGAEGLRGSIPVVCSPWVILAIVLCAAVTIYISTLIPAIKASKVMPIDALRQSNTIKVKGRSLRTPWYIRKLFGYEGDLAYKNIKRNGIKGSVITASIAISVILFITISFVCESVERANKYDLSLPCQLFASCSLDESEKFRAALENMEGVDDVYTSGIIQFNFVKSKNDDTTVLANSDIANRDYLTKEFSNIDLGGMTVVVIDDDDFKGLLKSNGLSEEKYFDGTLRGVLLNNYFHDTKSGAIFNDGILGQRLHYDDENGFPPGVEIGDFIKYEKDTKALELTMKEMIAIYVPASVYFEKAKLNIPEDILMVDYGVETSDHEGVYHRIYDMAGSEGYHNYSVSDLTDSLDVMNTITMMLKIVMYGFTALLTLITIANIVNTISTGILLRRKEFAMYKSVGMASGGFKKMLRLETFLYGFRALVFGLPASLALCYMMFRSFDSGLVAFTPNPVTYLIVIVAVFAVVGASMLLSVNKIKDDSIIDALKVDVV